MVPNMQGEIFDLVLKHDCDIRNVLDPFMGSGTTAIVSRKLNRNYIGFEINKDYVRLAENRMKKELGIFQ